MQAHRKWQDVLTLMFATLPNVKDLLRFRLAGSADAVCDSSAVKGAKCRLKHTHNQLIGEDNR